MNRAETPTSHAASFRDIPELPTWRPLGHLARFREDALGLLLEAQRTCGGLARVRIVTRQMLFVADPDIAEQVLVANPDRFVKQSRGYRLLRGLLGQGLLTAEGEPWRARRRLSQPAFGRGRIAGLATTMVTHTESACAGWEGREQLDVAEEMSHLTLRIVASTLFGAELGPERERIVGESLATALASFEQLLTTPLPRPDRMPLPAALRGERARRALYGVVDALIAERRTRPAGDDLLWSLISARDEHGGADDAELRDDALTLLLAGHETTAASLSWTLWLLALHPPTLRRLEAEVDAVLGGRSPTVEDLAKLPLVDHVLREGMRLYPPAWSISRVATEPIELGGYLVPKGTFVFVCPWAMHRHPALWANPEGFDPDRWEDPPAHKLAWVPFGAGQRKCIGEHFAMLEARLVLATIVQRWRLELVPGWPVVPEPSVTLRPRHGIAMRARARNLVRPHA